MAQATRQKVSFTASKKIKQPVKVNFRTTEGKRISFDARKPVAKPVKVNFYAKEKK